MIWTIPSSREEILINTPLGAKSVRYVYFENKNGGLFAFKSIPDSISISIDGKQICRDLIMLPFCTSSADGVRRRFWRDVAINTPLNIDNSQVRISGVRNNDFNIVFVLSAETVNENEGIDYYESRVLDYRRLLNIDDVFRNDMHSKVFSAESGVERSLSLEYAPQGFFAYSIGVSTDIVTSEFIRMSNKVLYLPKPLLNITAGDNECVAGDVHLQLFSCTDLITHNKAYYELSGSTHKNLLVKIDMKGQLDDMQLSCLQVILFFKSKRVL